MNIRPCKTKESDITTLSKEIDKVIISTNEKRKKEKKYMKDRTIAFIPYFISFAYLTYVLFPFVGKPESSFNVTIAFFLVSSITILTIISIILSFRDIYLFSSTYLKEQSKLEDIQLDIKSFTEAFKFQEILRTKNVLFIKETEEKEGFFIAIDVLYQTENMVCKNIEIVLDKHDYLHINMENNFDFSILDKRYCSLKEELISLSISINK